jgi:hypothetical protein
MLAAAPARAAAPSPSGTSANEVVIFQNELQPVTEYKNPHGCYNLPTFSHVLGNLTDRPIKVYAAPNCMGPSVTFPAGWGTHAFAPGSFAA